MEEFPTLLDALTVKTCGPSVPAAGVPLSTPALLRLTPVGRVPVMAKVGTGKPVALNWNVPAEPTVKMVLFALVIDGACFTVSLKAWSVLPTALVALIMMLYTPPDVAAGVPEILTVLVAALIKLALMPVGRVVWSME